MTGHTIMTKHPCYDYTLDDALQMARSIKYGPFLKPGDPVPEIAEAIEIVTKALRGCGFNWITGCVALQVLRSANGETVVWS